MRQPARPHQRGSLAAILVLLLAAAALTAIALPSVQAEPSPSPTGEPTGGQDPATGLSAGLGAALPDTCRDWTGFDVTSFGAEVSGSYSRACDDGELHVMGTLVDNECNANEGKASFNLFSTKADEFRNPFVPHSPGIVGSASAEAVEFATGDVECHLAVPVDFSTADTKGLRGDTGAGLQVCAFPSNRLPVQYSPPGCSWMSQPGTPASFHSDSLPACTDWKEFRVDGDASAVTGHYSRACGDKQLHVVGEAHDTTCDNRSAYAVVNMYSATADYGVTTLKNGPGKMGSAMARAETVNTDASCNSAKEFHATTADFIPPIGKPVGAEERSGFQVCTVAKNRTGRGTPTCRWQ